MSSEIDNELISIVKGFESISLSDLESLELLNRQDRKYLFGNNILIPVLTNLSSNYNVLKLNEKSIFLYDSTYFDTEQHDLYNLHHNGKMNRYKVRHRIYTDAKTSFLEVKFKTNKDITKKYRIPHDSLDINDQQAYDLIKSNVGIDPEKLKPVLQVKYHRITLIHKEFGEKITFDFDLKFKNTISKASLDGFVVAELKQNRLIGRSKFEEVMHEHAVRPDTISKYCTGSILTCKDLKYNRFKNKMMIINKICRENNGSKHF